MDILAFSSCFGMMSCWGKQKKTQIYFSKKIHIRHIWGHPLQNIWQLYGENILQEQYNMWGAHGAKMSTCCTPHSPPSSCSPKEAKLWSANAHCCQCYHLFIIIHSSDMSKQLFSDLQYVILGICRKRALALSTWYICWFGVPNYSCSEKNFFWCLSDNF